MAKKPEKSAASGKPKKVAKRKAAPKRKVAPLPDFAALDAIFEAQQLAFDAAEAASDEEALRLARRAIELDPLCVDARMIAAMLDAKDDADRIAQVAAAVSAGETALGSDFGALRGEFWGLIETRPYMRAREQLVALLIHAGRFMEAIEHAREMLDLNPNDNQGIRQLLLCLQLRVGLLDAAESLLRRYKGDDSAWFAWGGVLERHLSGDEPAALKALALARELNPHVEDFLAHGKHPPQQPPDHYIAGEESEAVHAAFDLLPAWSSHPRAIAWLAAQR